MDDYDFDGYDEYGADPSDWDDLGTLSDQEGWESGQADAYADAEDYHLEADYEDQHGDPDY